jgi:uncharacterized tellurite resistance protein B-like protein
MFKILVPIIIGVAASACIIFFNLVNRKRLTEVINQLKSGSIFSHFNISDFINHFRKESVSKNNNPKPSVEVSSELDLTILNCRVKLSEYKDGDCISDAFEVEICGSIHTPREVQAATLKISITDITEPESEAKSIHGLVKQWQVSDSTEFCYNAKLGKLPHQITTMSDWTSIALLRLDWLELPRKGKRKLMFETSIFPDDGGERIAHASFVFEYDNPDFGYLDSRENIQRSKTLAIALAFAVSAVDEKLHDCEIKLIKKWTKENVDLSETTAKERRKLDKAFKEIIAYFKSGKKLNNYNICQEIVEIVPLEDRYGIMDLCLHVAQANGSVTEKELNLLKDIAGWLEIDVEKFREMIQKVFPIEKY